MTPIDWPSLAPQIVLSERLFGARGASLVGTWLDEQVGRTTDPAFARLFSDHIDLPGVVPGDYNHRIVQASRGRLLGGIRFYGHDIARPFVEIVAHDFEDWGALRDCVAAEWTTFAPLHLRTLTAPSTALPEDAYVDMTIHAARYRDMALADGSVVLAPFAEAEEAIAMVAVRFEDLAMADPALARNISAADPDDLRHWHDQDQIRAIRAMVDGTERNVGLLAAAPGAVEWIEGDEVHEEIVASAFNGHGFAASAQKAWAARADVDPDRLLVGTIDRLNAASRCSAVRAGRRGVLDYTFVPLGECC